LRALGIVFLPGDYRSVGSNVRRLNTLEEKTCTASFLLVRPPKRTTAETGDKSLSFRGRRAMKKPPVSLLSSTRPVHAHQELAVAVIRQAVLDAANPLAESRVRDGARAFLADSPMLRQWCGVA
jgi:hypothetical protein